MKLFDPTRPVQTRDGRKADILPRRLEGTAHTLIVVCETSAGVERLFQYNCLGERNDRNGATWGKHTDLINIPETHEVVVYFFNSHRPGETYIRDTNVSAEAIASKLITFTVGEFEEEQGT